MYKERTIKEIANFLNVDKKDLILSTNQKILDKMVHLWDNDLVIEIHQLGYELKK